MIIYEGDFHSTKAFLLFGSSALDASMDANPLRIAAPGHTVAIERQLRRSRGLIEQTRQRTQDGQINEEPMIEFDSETLRNASHTLSETRQHSPRFGRILYYAAYVLHFGLSEVQIGYLEELMKVLYQHESPISHREIENFFKNILESYNIRISYFCSSCTDLMEATQNYCQNAMCGIYRQNFKRAKRMQRTEVHLIDIKPQLEDILEKNINEIISFHDFLHYRRGSFDESRSDIRCCEGYKNRIETPEDFHNRHLKILLSASIDGFCPRRLSKREVWPLYLRIDGLSPTHANEFFNSILSGVIYTRLKPNEKLIETLFSRLESELQYLRDFPIRIVVNGNSWLIQVDLNRGVADMAAQQILYGLPKWNTEFGCSKCLIRGVRVGNHRLWITENDHDFVLRSRESYLIDARLRRFGLTKITPVMKLFLPCDFLCDALHMCSEGVSKDRLRDMFSTGSKFPELKVDNGIIRKLKRSLMGTSFHTYSNSIVLSLEDLPTCKATEVDELAFVAFPLSVAVGAIQSPVASVSLLGYWLSLTIISRCASLTRALIDDAKVLASLTKEIWVGIAPEICIMKFHWFFDHAMKEEITMYGSAYQWSACPFESHHRRLQIGINQSTTNSAALIVERYLLLKKIRLLLQEYSFENDALRALQEKIENRHKKRYPQDIYVNEHMYIPKNSTVALEELLLSEQELISSNEEAYSRLVVDNKIYSSRVYHGREKRSRQDLIHFEDENGSDGYGSITLFLYNRSRNSVQVLLKEYQTDDCFVSLEEALENCSSLYRDSALNLLSRFQQCNRYFREIRGGYARIRSASVIKGSCLLITYENRTFVLRK